MFEKGRPLVVEEATETFDTLEAGLSRSSLLVLDCDCFLLVAMGGVLPTAAGTTYSISIELD